MQFTNLLSILPLVALTFASPTPAAAPTKPDNTKLVVADVATISKDLTTLNNTLNGFKPDAPLGLFTALQIQKETDAIATQLNKTIQDVKASRKFNSDESFTIASAFVNLIAPINSTITNVVAHKPAFASAVFFVGDLSKTVQAALQEQRALTAQLGAALKNKLAAPYSTFSPQVTAQILGIFDAAIKKYATCSGVLCLPPIPSFPS